MKFLSLLYLKHDMRQYCSDRIKEVRYFVLHSLKWGQFIAKSLQNINHKTCTSFLFFTPAIFRVPQLAEVSRTLSTKPDLEETTVNIDCKTMAHDGIFVMLAATRLVPSYGLNRLTWVEYIDLRGHNQLIMGRWPHLHTQDTQTSKVCVGCVRSS